jgi:hypothetical protein
MAGRRRRGKRRRPANLDLSGKIIHLNPMTAATRSRAICICGIIITG